MLKDYTFDFRQDVQGLRGIAVLMVVLYHAGLPLHGGFVGVDVFFVISGFVITGGILKSLARQTFSFGEFYRRRVRRLLPALSFVLTVTLLLGPFFGPRITQVASARAAIAAIFWNANHYLYRSGGYFAGTSELNTALHTWSLSVEEQFYLAFPLVIWLLVRRSSRPLRTATIGIAGLSLVSFVVSVWLTFTPEVLGLDGPRIAFYSSFTRSWQFGAGALVALAVPVLRESQVVKSHAFRLLGIGLIAAGGLVFDKSTAFPGFAALAPTIGAVLMLIARPAKSSWLERRLLVRVGDLSYSWYLWHWPLIVFASATFPQFGLLSKVSAALVSLVLAIGTERWLENPIRFRAKDDQWPIWAVVGACCLVPMAAWWLQSLFDRSDQGMVAAYTEMEADYLALGCDSATVFDDLKDECRWNLDGEFRVLLLGDSNARQHIPAVSHAVVSDNGSLVVSTLSACPFLDRLSTRSDRIRTACHRWVSETLKEIERRPPDLVVLAAAWDYYALKESIGLQTRSGSFTNDPEEKLEILREGAAQVVDRIRSNGAPVIVVSPIPKFLPPSYEPEQVAFANEPNMFGSCSAIALGSWPNACAPSRSLESSDWLAMSTSDPVIQSAVDAGAQRLDLGTALCPSGTCEALKHDVWLYRDREHVSPHGSLSTSADFRLKIQRALKLSTH